MGQTEWIPQNPVHRKPQVHTEHLMMKNKFNNKPEQSTCYKEPLWHRWACLPAGPTQPIPHFVPAYKNRVLHSLTLVCRTQNTLIDKQVPPVREGLPLTMGGAPASSQMTSRCTWKPNPRPWLTCVTAGQGVCSRQFGSCTHRGGT